jgi:uncharacterized repeat protein (TIGR01451 family)
MIFRDQRRALLAASTLVMLALSAAVFGLSAARADSGSTHAGPYVVVKLLGAIRHGDALVPIDKAGTVQPGEIVRWTVAANNQGSASAMDYSVSGRVPSGTEFVTGSALGENSPQVTYSIDGGKAYSQQPTVQQKQPDGSVTTVPAPIPTYTNVRFTWSASIPAGESRTATYDVRVK